MLPLPILNVRLNACREDWQQMTPTAQGHHCAQCNRTVIDFTTGTQADLEAAFQTASDGRVCGRFRPSQLAPPPRLRPKLRRFLVALVLVCGLGLTSGEAWSQVRQAAKIATPSTPEYVFGGAEEMPVFNGGAERLMQVLSTNLRWPAINPPVAGKVFVTFIVDKTGGVREAQVVKGLHPAADTEALRLVRLLDKQFEPGKQNGHPVEVRYTVPITFKPN